MTPSVTALAVLLVAAAVAPRSQAQHNPSFCCFDFIKKEVPLRNLRSYEFTNFQCVKSAVVFILKNHQRVCADPQAQWVKSRLRHLPPN